MAEVKPADSRFGWKLIDLNPPSHCNRCREHITLPYFYCKESEQAFCQDCELNYTRICGHKYTHRKIEESEHIHYNITEIRNQ